jgi:hypothetical protein
MPPNPLTQYMITSIAGSTVVATAHGWFTTKDIQKTATHAMYGIFMGPWSPIAVPYMLMRPYNQHCSFLNKFHWPK